MQIELRCFATLREYCPSQGVLELPEGADLAALLAHLDIPADEVKLLFVNGRRVNSDTRLKEGDRVGLFPPVGGG